MPARATRLTVWTDLQAAGGVQLAPLRRARQWQTTYRTDGDDRLTGEWPLELHRAAGVTIGQVLRLERADSTVEEWVLEKADEDPVKNTLALTALPMLAWFGERVLVRDGTDVALTLSGTLSQVLTALLATDEWPSWCVVGTLDRDPTISVTLDGANGRDALRAILAAANAADEVALQGETMRLVPRRVSASQVALDWLTAAPSGVVVLEEGKNIATPRKSSDRVPQVQAVLPIGAAGAGITEAYAWIRTGNPGLRTLELRDWSYRADRLWIAYDGQWVGQYIINRAGTAYLIEASSAANQTVTIANTPAWNFDTDSIVRIAADGSGTAITEVGVAGATNPRRVLDRGEWTGAINWARNAQFNEWVLGPDAPRDWTNNSSTSWTITRETGATFRETGTSSIKFVTDGTNVARTLAMNSMPVPDDIVSPGGGTQTWECGIRVYFPATGYSVGLQYSTDNGGSWINGPSGAAGGAGTWSTFSGTFTTTSASDSPLIRIWIVGAGSASRTFYVDRVWLFRNAVDDADNTVAGCDPAIGIYRANRQIAASRLGALAYDFGARDRYRADPTTYPFDKLTVHGSARLRSRTLGLDDSSLQIAELTQDELRPLRTTVRLGSLRRRLTDRLR